MDNASINRFETHPDSVDAKRGGGLGWFLWPVTLVLAYVLSVGPVERLAHAALLPYTPVTMFYGPLREFCVAHDLTLKLYDSYITLWGLHLVDS
jgi:hypothetical protein